jgi:agmatinase
VLLNYETVPPYNFLGLTPELSDRARSRALVLPIPYEMTTTYGGGTKGGPRAIIEASRMVELYDIQLGCEPATKWGIRTLPAIGHHLQSPEAAINNIAGAVGNILSAFSADDRRLLVTLGGEHAISIGVVRAFKKHFGDFVIVQLDAHADLRDGYEGTAYSHASAGRRMSEICPVIQLGVRSVDISEVEFLRSGQDRVNTIFAHEMHESDEYIRTLLQAISGKRVYLSIDLDYLDCSLMPATGAPEPGGFNWYQTVRLLEEIVSCADVIGLDCVELAPISGNHAPDYVAAKLVYKAISLILNSPSWQSS